MLLEKYTLAEVKATCEDIRMGKRVSPKDEHEKFLYKTLSKYFSPSYAQYLECEFCNEAGDVLQTIRKPLSIIEDAENFKKSLSPPDGAVEGVIWVSYDKEGKDTVVVDDFYI